MPYGVGRGDNLVGISVTSSQADFITAQIQHHIDIVTGNSGNSKAALTVVPGLGIIIPTALNVCKDPTAEWIPPPWFDVNKIRDPELRAKWQKADHKELKGILEDRKCAREVLLDEVLASGVPMHDIIGSLMNHSIKRDDSLKSRALSRGDHMQQFTHYYRSHAPTMMAVSQRFLFAFGAAHGLKFAGGDFSQAFANAPLDTSEQYYMWPPPGARQTDEQGRRIVWHVEKSLYGGKNSARNWFKLLRKFLISYNFTPCPTEPCIFSRRQDGHVMIIGVYVDDFLVLYDDEDQFTSLATEIKKTFDFTVQSPLVDMCGIEVTETPGHITLTLTSNITNMATRFLTGEDLTKSKSVPCTDAHDGTALEDLVKKAISSQSEVDAEIRKEFQEIVGSLLYIAMVVRPDIAYSVGMLSRAMSSPSPELLESARDVLRYLYTTRDLGLRYRRCVDAVLSGQADSDWGVEASVSAYVFFMAGCAISYLSKKQPTIAMSSTEAEIYAASLAGLEAIFLRSLVEQLSGYVLESPTVIDVDNTGAVNMSEDYVANSRNRHFTRRHLKVRELVEDELVRLNSIPTDENVSDIMTKPLSVRRFRVLRAKLLNM